MKKGIGGGERVPLPSPGTPSALPPKTFAFIESLFEGGGKRREDIYKDGMLTERGG